ncbi:hypothetical protein F5B21DRAFT_359281 [Xylaria acuta]|nr:hypothetical protein F5B21DRAFT_359281 [Xylaria acuta]
MSFPELECLLGLQVPVTFKLPLLRRPTSIALEADTLNHTSVRQQLVAQRRADPTWRDPTRQKRRFIRDIMSKGKTEHLANSENWEFSKFEIGKAIDSFLHQDEWRIEDVLAFIELSGETTESLWLHSQDRNLEAALAEGNTPPKITSRCQWLKLAVQRGVLPMITLLCHHHMAQNDLDDALDLALANGKYAEAKELLRFGASFSNSASIIPAVNSQPPDLEYLMLWVTALKRPNHAITIQAMESKARSPADQQDDSDVLDILLSNWEISSSEAYGLLSLAIEAENLLSILRISRAIGHSWTAPFAQDSGQAVVSSAVMIKDASLRRIILEFLLVAGVKANVKSLRAELLKSVIENRADLIKLLIRFGVSPHESHSNSVDCAVKQSKVDILALLLSATIPPDRASQAVDKIPDSMGEDCQVSLVSLLLNRGATGKPLDKLLVRAVRNNHLLLAGTLLKNKASIDFGDAAAVRAAIENNRLDMLDMLLDSEVSTPSILSKALPTAMAIVDNQERRYAVTALVRKGARGVELDMALQNSVSDVGPREDGQLISLLLDHGASPDYEDANGNCMAIAVARSQVGLVRELSNKARLEVTLSNGIPLALAALTSSNYDEVVEMIEILMKKGAKGALVEKTLLEAIPVDPNLRIIKTLSRNGLAPEIIASAIHSAAQMEDLGALKLFCDKKSGFKVPRDTLREEILMLLYGPSYNTSKTLILLEYGRRYPEILSPMLAHKGLEHHSARVEVAALLVLCGASIDFNDGAVLNLSCKLGDVDMTRVLLRGSPNQASLAKALAASAREGPQKTKYEIMSMILKCNAADIGQNEALIIVTKQLTLQQDDTKLVKLLLRYNASANHDKGQAICFAIKRLSIPVLKELVRQRLDVSNLVAPFKCARRVKCTDEIRYNLFQELLKAGYRPGSSQALEQALIESLERSPESFLVPGLLLSSGASLEFKNGEAICIIVRAGAVSTLSSLLQYDIDTKHLSPAFNLLIDSDIHRNKKYAMSSALLEKGIDQARRDWALRRQFNVPAQLDQRLIDLLLRYKSTPHCFDGECFSIAALEKNESVFRALAAAPFDIGVVTSSLIDRLDMAAETVRWLQLCCEQSTKKGRIESQALVRAIRKHPAGDKLVNLLLAQGCDARYQVEISKGKKTSLLFWATRERKVSDRIILKLLEHGADGFLSGLENEQTVAHAAAIVGRAAVMRQLIQRKVNIDSPDASQLTPLSHATFRQNLDTMDVLVQAGARLDDSSLHIATAKCFVEGVSLLLQAGHEADFPSLILDGATPLAMLCLCGESTGTDWVERLHKTMKMIKKAVPHDNITSRFDNNSKTVLHIALDNQHEATNLTRALLTIYKPYKSVDINESFLFIDEKGLRYSPTKYVELCCGNKPAAEKAELIQCLKAQKFRDRYFADGMNQPAGAVGLPAALSAAIKEEERSERKRQREIQQKRELAELEAKLQADLHKQVMQDKELEAQQEIELARREAEVAREEHRKSKQQQLDLEVSRMKTIRRHEEQALEEQHEVRKRQALELGTIASAQQMIESQQALELKAAEYQMEMMYRRMTRELEDEPHMRLMPSYRQLPNSSRRGQIEYLPD